MLPIPRLQAPASAQPSESYNLFYIGYRWFERKDNSFPEGRQGNTNRVDLINVYVATTRYNTETNNVNCLHHFTSLGFLVETRTPSASCSVMRWEKGGDRVHPLYTLHVAPLAVPLLHREGGITLKLSRSAILSETGRLKKRDLNFDKKELTMTWLVHVSRLLLFLCVFCVPT